jgi:hypothetical protein
MGQGMSDFVKVQVLMIVYVTHGLSPNGLGAARIEPFFVNPDESGLVSHFHMNPPKIALPKPARAAPGRAW